MTPSPSSEASAPAAAAPSPSGDRARRLVATLLIIAGVLTFVYTSASTYIATLVVQQKPLALAGTPAATT